MGGAFLEIVSSQKAWSTKTFGPARGTEGVIDHIRKELKEIEAAPTDLEEWIDVIILAIDGAWRSGHTPEQVARKLEEKMAKNRTREWPDWREADPKKAIEHLRGKAATKRRLEVIRGMATMVLDSVGWKADLKRLQKEVAYRYPKVTSSGEPKDRATVRDIMARRAAVTAEALRLQEESKAQERKSTPEKGG
jgi:hypothetical protein